MAMYYQGNSEIQADGLHTLYRMNPNYVGYGTDSTQHQLQHVEGINIPLFHNPNRPSSLIHHHQQDIIGDTNSMITIPRFNYNNWESFDQAGTSSTTNEQRPKNLSLSLSVPHYQTAGCISKQSIHRDGDFLGQSSVGVMLVADHQQSVVMGSKYLKAAQHLLDEVLNVGKEIQFDGLVEDSKGKAKVVRESIRMNAEAFNGAELTSAQRQEILMKRTKLVSMLEEVEQRYRQYHHQMQITVASFEQAAGIGSSKSYTHVALQTISKQFRCLKDTLSKQISALNKNLGEIEKTDSSSNRFKFIVDHQFGRQRSLQQLGMMPNNNNAWRHQRGLPESAVSVLRAWLFENFLHPYPKDSDKQMLAKQTGLTRSQVSNWFINARVRLWKPMVEQMYLDEINKNDQQQCTITGSVEKNKTEKNPKKARHDGVAHNDNSPRNTNLSVKKEINNMKSSVRNHYGIEELGRFEEHKLATGFYGNSNNDNVVSLSLGLPPASGISSEFGLSANNNTRSGVHHGINICDGGSNNIAYEILDFQNPVNKPFSAEQLFPDFLA